MAERARLAGALASLALLAPLTVLATSAPASAERVTLADPARDVVRTTITDGDETDSVYDSTDTGTDVRRLVVRHAARKVTLTLHVRDLVRGERGRSAHFDIVDTSKGTMIGAAVRVGRTPARDQAFAFDPGGEGTGGTCRGVRHAVSARNDTIAVIIPRRCLGNPRWVRATASIMRTAGRIGVGKDGEPGFHVSQDDAGADGRRPFAMPRATRRVHVG